MLADEAPTGPQHRVTVRQHTAVAEGPPTPRPPRSGPLRAGPSPRRRDRDPRMAPWIVMGLLIVATLAIGGWLLVTVLGRDAGTESPASPVQRQEQATGTLPTSGETEATSTTASVLVTITVEDYRGESAQDVADDLTNRGLRPSVVTGAGLSPDDPDNCLVTDVAPAGAVAKGSPVTVTCQPEAG